MDGEDQAGKLYTFIALENRHLTANFAINEYILNYSAEDHGSIAGECIQTVEHGSDDYEHGQTAILIATSHDENNYIFKNWTEEESIVHDEPEYVFTVTTNRILTANYQNVTNVSIPEIISTIKVFPLPATNFLNIESECLIQKIILLDLAGRIRIYK